MRYFKIILKFLFVVAILFCLSIVVILLVDKFNTSYLKLANNDSFKDNTYLISNVNIIPMNKDTVLPNKMVYIQDGIIDEIGDFIEKASKILISSAL